MPQLIDNQGVDASLQQTIAAGYNPFPNVNAAVAPGVGANAPDTSSLLASIEAWIQAHPVGLVAIAGGVLFLMSGGARRWL